MGHLLGGVRDRRTLRNQEPEIGAEGRQSASYRAGGEAPRVEVGEIGAHRRRRHAHWPVESEFGGEEIDEGQNFPAIGAQGGW